MPAPRLEIDLGKIEENASALVTRLATRGISVTGVTKATLGSPEIASAFLRAGVRDLGDSRIANIETMRVAQRETPMTLIRSPMRSQVDRVVTNSDISFNTEIEIIGLLSHAAQRADRTHGILLMVELGDLREGILPGDLASIVQKTIGLPNIVLKGIGANLACRNGVCPSSTNMAVLSELADSVDDKFGIVLETVSGGNSSGLSWALDCPNTGRVNNLRLGESILLGCDPLDRKPIEALHTDAFELVAEVIESKRKPSAPWGKTAQNAFGETSSPSCAGTISQTIFAIGRQDTDTDGLRPPSGIEILGASSDHLITDTGATCRTPGNEARFQLNYSALLRAMTSPFVTKAFH